MDVSLSVVAVVSGMLFSYIGYQRGTKDESKKAGRDEGVLNTDIQYIKRRTDEVLLEQKDTNRNIGFLTERVTRVEEGVKAVDNRVDTLEADLKDCKRANI